MLAQYQARMQGGGGGARGCVAPPLKNNLAKIKKKEKNHKIKKIKKILPTIPFTNGSKVRSFQGGNPPQPNFDFFRNPHLPKINPAYAPAQYQRKTIGQRKLDNEMA